jgi:hypothetical protein
VELVAIAAGVGFVGIAVFQIALALGAPWGRAAWGGRHERLPTGYRIASLFAAVFWIVAALVVLAAGGFEWSPVSAATAEWATWVLFGLLVVGTLMNLASRSRIERAIQTPLAAALAGLCLVLALS